MGQSGGVGSGYSQLPSSLVALGLKLVAAQSMQPRIITGSAGVSVISCTMV